MLHTAREPSLKVFSVLREFMAFTGLTSVLFLMPHFMILWFCQNHHYHRHHQQHYYLVNSLFAPDPLWLPRLFQLLCALGWTLLCTLGWTNLLERLGIFLGI